MAVGSGLSGATIPLNKMQLRAAARVRWAQSTADITSATLPAGSADIAPDKQWSCKSSAGIPAVVACRSRFTFRADAIGNPAVDKLDSNFERVDRERECVPGECAGRGDIRQRNLFRIRDSRRPRCRHEHHGNVTRKQVVKLAARYVSPPSEAEAERSRASRIQVTAALGCLPITLVR